VGVLRGGSIVGIDHEPFMPLAYGCTIRRLSIGYSAVGSATGTYADLPGVTPCDVSPMSDDLKMFQTGQQEMLTHIIHFQAGTNVKIRDEIRIVYAPQPDSYGNVGDTYILEDVLTPSEDLAYIRCRAYKGTVPTA